MTDNSSEVITEAVDEVVEAAPVQETDPVAAQTIEELNLWNYVLRF